MRSDANKNNENESVKNTALAISDRNGGKSLEKCIVEQTEEKKILTIQYVYGKSDEVTELHPPQAKIKYEIIAVLSKAIWALCVSDAI